MKDKNPTGDGGEGKGKKTGFKAKYAKLTEELNEVITDYGLVSHYKLNPKKPETLKAIVYNSDMMIQYAEHQEVRESTFREVEERM